jgi:hypothetical protein
MSTGNYGTIRPADVSVNDMEIYYHYSPSRSTTGNVNLIKISNPNEIIKKVDDPSNPGQIFGGMYTLTLPTTIFNLKGIYSIIIRPKQISTNIIDCGILSAFPDIKGVIFDASTISAEDINKFENQGLVGYRIEYLSTDPTANEKKIQNLFRIVTSNNKCEPVSENLTNTTQKSIKYRFNDNSTLIFCTVTPSSSPNVKPNAQPFIGVPGQKVIITNTYFNPIMVEIEMVENDFDTLANGLFGNQTRSNSDGIYTIYNTNDEIYKQYDLYEIKDDYGKPLFEVREERDNIDFTKDFNQITGGVQ